MIRRAVAVLVVACAWQVSAAAPDEQKTPGTEKPPAASAPEAPKKQELGAWWQKNATEFKPFPAQWLFHAEGTLSYMNAVGNTSGSTLDTTGSAEVRKDRFTSNSFVQLSRKDVVYGFGQGSVNFIERTLREQVDCAVTKSVKLVAGVEAYRNTLMFMNKRVNVYGGVGATIFRTPKQQVTFTGGLGHANFSFDRDRMMVVNPREFGVLNTDPASGGGVGLQTWRWAVSPRFSFSEDASYMKYFDSYLGYRWTINLSGNVPINKHLSFTVTYRVREEDNTIIKALRVATQDRVFLMGIRASI